VVSVVWRSGLSFVLMNVWKRAILDWDSVMESGVELVSSSSSLLLFAEEEVEVDGG